MDRVGIGIVGMGSFGRRHAEVCANLAETRLAAVCSRREDSVRPVAEEYGAFATTDLRRLVEHPGVDAVIVCTPDHAHKEAAVAATHAGKHVFVEKPMATRVEDCEEMAAAAAEAGVKLTVGQILRFDPRYFEMRARIARGEAGRLIYMYARRNNPRGAAERAFGRTTPTFWLGSHDIDMFLWCASAPVAAVYARNAGFLLPAGQGPDAVLALLTFADGAQALLETCWVLPDGAPSSLDALFEAVGTEGRLQVDASCDGLTAWSTAGVEHPRSAYGAELHGLQTGALAEEVRHFARCVREDTPPAVSPAEGTEVVRVACAIDHSAATGEVVRL